MGRGWVEFLAASRRLEAEGVPAVAGSFVPVDSLGLAPVGSVSPVEGLEDAPGAMVEGLEVVALGDGIGIRVAWKILLSTIST